MNKSISKILLSLAKKNISLSPQQLLVFTYLGQCGEVTSKEFSKKISGNLSSIFYRINTKLEIAGVKHRIECSHRAPYRWRLTADE